MSSDRKTDKRTIGLTARGRNVVEAIVGGGLFNDRLDLAKFAMALAMQDTGRPMFIDGTDTTWNVGSFDPDGEIKGLFSVLYPDEESPYRLAETLIDAGLDKLAGRIQGGGELDVSSLLAAPFDTAETFADYELIEQLSGGMAETYLARHVPSGDSVFLKRVKLVATDDVSALQREASIYERLMRVNCPHVLSVRDYGRRDEYLFLVTDFADGGDLTTYVQSRPGHRLDTPEAKTIALEVISGIRALHEQNIVHRDLKPGNILRLQGAWKLADFGIAKNLARVVTQRTFRQTGTPGYAPPEQFDGVQAHPSADVHAFGKLLVFLLSGQTDVDIILFPSWRNLIRRCIDPDRSKRPTALEVMTDLLAIPA